MKKIKKLKKMEKKKKNEKNVPSNQRKIEIYYEKNTKI